MLPVACSTGSHLVNIGHQLEALAGDEGDDDYDEDGHHPVLLEKARWARCHNNWF